MNPCTKRAYLSKRDAKKAIRSAQRQGKRLWAYRCPACRRWHLTRRKW